MPDRLPPLTALRAFDAAARHVSFAKAAEELHVTPAALSYQIKSLEDHLGTLLFRRLNRAVELTPAGAALAPGAKDGFQTLAAAWRSAQRTLDDRTLMVTAGPAFTAKWLAPRLYEFARDHPEIELRFSASLKIVDLLRDGVDVAIRFGVRSNEDQYYVMPFGEEWVCPVMTPEVAEQYPTPESLKTAPLLIDESIAFLSLPSDWDSWFRAVGIDYQPDHGLHFSQADHSIDAALAGAGVVLGRRALVVKDLADGRLVAPFKTALRTGARFRFLCAKGAETRPHVAAFRDWIISETEKLQYITDQMQLVSSETS